jgi:hypothetical protein
VKKAEVEEAVGCIRSGGEGSSGCLRKGLVLRESECMLSGMGVLIERSRNDIRERC